MKGKSKKKNETLWKNCMRACAAAFLVAAAVISLPQYVSAGSLEESSSTPGFVYYYFAGSRSFSDINSDMIKAINARAVIKNDDGTVFECINDNRLLVDKASREILYEAQPGDTVEISMLAFCEISRNNPSTRMVIDPAVTQKVIIGPCAYVSDNHSTNNGTTVIMYRKDMVDETTAEKASEVSNCFKPQVITSTEAQTLSDAAIEKLFGYGQTWMKDLKDNINGKEVHVPLTDAMKTAIKAGTPGDYRVGISCTSTDGVKLTNTVGIVVMDDVNAALSLKKYSRGAVSAKAADAYADGSKDTVAVTAKDLADAKINEEDSSKLNVLRLLANTFDITSYNIDMLWSKDKDGNRVAYIDSDHESAFLYENADDESPLVINSVMKKDANGKYTIASTPAKLLAATDGSYSVTIYNGYFSPVLGDGNDSVANKDSEALNHLNVVDPENAFTGYYNISFNRSYIIADNADDYNYLTLYVNVAEKPELSFKTTKYVIQYADYKGDYAGDSTLPLDIMLKVNGQEVTDAATLSKITFTNKMIDRFTGKTWNVADVSTDGTLTLSGRQSGIIELSMSYNGTESTNKAVVIIPGDLDASGTIALNDAVQEAAILRGTVEAASVSAAYGDDLTNMNNIPGVDVDDVVKIVTMIRGMSDYYNGPTS